jgi:hypothetical protein
MSTDLIHPLTGETLSLVHAGEDQLAQLLDSVKDYESRLREAKSLLSQEILRRQDQSACWTTRAGGFVLKGSSPAPSEEFDALALREDLLGLVDEGALHIQAVDAAVETVISYRARKGGINQLRKLGGVVAQIIDRHATPVIKSRYISVSRDA